MSETRMDGHSRPAVNSDPISRNAGTDHASYFTVFVNGEIFGLPVHESQTIFRIASITLIPNGPPEIVGLVNLRGKVVTAVSLKQRMGMSLASTSDRPLAIEIERRGEHFALIVDEVGDVIFINASMEVPVPKHLDEARSRFSSKLFRVGERLIPILDVEKLFDFNRP